VNEQPCAYSDKSPLGPSRSDSLVAITRALDTIAGSISRAIDAIDVQTLYRRGGEESAQAAGMVEGLRIARNGILAGCKRITARLSQAEGQKR
jgi:predicted transcriptional regulator